MKGMKSCSKCKTLKPVEEFYSNGKGGLQARCKACFKQFDSIRQNQFPERRVRANRVYGRTFRYGIKPSEYDLILAYQDWKCASCSTEDPGGHGTFNVDHNHSTNEIRGLLCMLCNVRVGWFERDNRDIRRYLISR